LRLAVESGKIKRTNTISFDSSIRSWIKIIDATSFDNNIEQKIWNSIRFDSNVVAKKANLLTLFR